MSGARHSCSKVALCECLAPGTHAVKLHRASVWLQALMQQSCTERVSGARHSCSKVVSSECLVPGTHAVKLHRASVWRQALMQQSCTERVSGARHSCSLLRLICLLQTQIRNNNTIFASSHPCISKLNNNTNNIWAAHIYPN